MEGTGDGAYRSSLRRALTAALQQADELLRGGTATRLLTLVQAAYTCLACMQGVLPQRHTSFVAHTAAAEFWAQHVGPVTHCSLEELRKALAAGLPKEVGALWALKLHVDGPTVADRDFGAFTDLLGLVGGLAKATNQVTYILSGEGYLARTVLLSSTWADDVRLGKPLRNALEHFGRVNKWCEADAVGSMLVEMEEEHAAAALLRKELHGKDPQGLTKALLGHAVVKAAESVDDAALRKVVVVAARGVLCAH